MSDLSEYSQYDIERIVKMKIVEAIRQRNKELIQNITLTIIISNTEQIQGQEKEPESKDR